MLSLGKFALAMAVIPFLSKCTFSCHKNGSRDGYKHEITFNEWSALVKKLEQPTYEHATLNYRDFYQSNSGTNLVEESFEYSFVNGEWQADEEEGDFLLPCFYLTAQTMMADMTSEEAKEYTFWSDLEITYEATDHYTEPIYNSNGEYLTNITIDDTYYFRYRYDEPYGGLPTQIYDYHERFLSADIYNDEIAEAIESTGYDYGRSVYETASNFDYYN